MRARALLAAAAGALTLGVAGCTAGTTATVSATGHTLTVYISAPAGSGSDQRVQDVLDAEQLAFARLSGSVTAYKLRLRVLDAARLSDNARTAIEDSAAIAYVGEIDPGDSADSAGITNAQDLLQVTPTDTAVELTQPSAAASGAPNKYFEDLKSYGRTFARVVPTSSQEAKAQAQEMSSLKVRRLYVSSDGSEYGAASAQAVRSAAASAGITVVGAPGGAQGAFYGSGSPGAAESFFDRLGQAQPQLKLFGPSGLADPGFASAISPSLRSVYVSSPGFLSRDLPAAARKSFVSPFQSTYHHAPVPEAIFGYEAMAAVLAVLQEDGSQANNRARVVHDFFSIRNRASVLGTYSIDASGDTDIAPFVFSRVSAGKLVPLRFLQAQG